MTEENSQYRTSQTMLRNQFEGEGTFQIPVVPKSEFTEEDFRDLLLIGFDRARPDDEKNRDRMVHFFLYDYKFERVWKDAEKDFFMKGYREMLRRIEPERIICYNTPFPEMEGHIVFVDYELSSWKYQEKECRPFPYVKYITGELPLPENSGIIIKRGCLISTDKGMGSAYGAQWKPNPNKPNDMALKGAANTVQRIYISTKKGGYWIQVKYGEDGWAVVVRHETIHSLGSGHTDPHDHIMEYDPNTHAPMWGTSEVINYPNGAPERKQLKESDTMSNQDFIVLHYDDEAMRFKTISEFKNSLVNGGEIVIEWNDVEYGIFRERNRFFIGHGTPEENVYYDSPDELLEYRVGNDRLRDVITKVIVIDRTL